MGIIGFKTVLSTDVSSTNPDVGDLFLNEDGTHASVTSDSDAERVRAAAQGIQQRLSLVKGEYFLNIREGVPYFTEILVKNPNLALIRSLVKQVIFTYPGIVAVTNVTTTLDRSTRELSVSFDAQLDGGVEFSSDDFGPILLELKLGNLDKS